MTSHEPLSSPTEEIKALGLKVTQPRTRILELFQQSTTRHLTAEDVYRVLLEENSSIGFATVYRVLMQFETAGILLRRSFDPEKSYYELNDGMSHEHLICLDCGVVNEFYDADIIARQTQIAAEQGFSVYKHSTTLFAHCTRTDCVQTRKPARK